ncbi:MAG: 4Fe-4S binding protein [Alphaproteobacteria bacterium]
MKTVQKFLAGLLILIGVAALTPALAAGDDLSHYLSKVPATVFFADADGYGPPSSAVPAVPVLSQGKILGYVFLNTDLVGAVGYSGKPIKVLIGLTAKGRIAGAKLVKHSEPIVLAGIPEQRITDFIDGYKDADILAHARDHTDIGLPVDIVSGATVTVMVIDDTIHRSAVRVARALGLGGLSAPVVATAKRTVITSGKAQLDWLALLGEGAVRRLQLTVGQINARFERQGNAKAIARPEKGASDDTFIDLYVASLAVPQIARSLMGSREYANLQKRLTPGQQAILVMGRGRYSFRGSAYVRGGIFSRIQLVQGDDGFRFRDRGYKNLGRVAAQGAPRFGEVALFLTPKDATLDPTLPWQLQLLVQRQIGALEKAFLAFDLYYQLPKKYVQVEESTPLASQPTGPATAAQARFAPSTALWQRIWWQKRYQTGALVLAISFLTVLFFAQTLLVRYRALTDAVRTGFLIFTLFGIGFYAQAQLSVVNVFAFVNALLTGFRWEYFLMEPLIFVLWGSVVVGVLFWGRGPFCGWLCPFGALQELLNKVAKFFKVPQISVPWWLHERLWPIKYLIFLGLVGVSVYSIDLAEHLAEVEPFKTAIVLKFARGWPYVLFVAILLGAGLFIERFYCRYLCPLGAALAIPGRLRLFNWLKRYPNCGDPCQICSQQCMVQAIEPNGDINPNECFDCLHCQQLYYDKKVCPVVIHRFAKTAKAKGPGSPGGPGSSASAGGAASPPAPGTVPLSQYRRPRRLGRTREYDT